MRVESPLDGVNVVEFAGLGPGPQAAWQLADFGASLTTIDRPGKPASVDTSRSDRRHVALDLKSAEGHRAALALLEEADVLIEGFRPGVMERLGLGPDDCWAVNPRLIYGRMTGWGQDGPLAQRAGHDINYISLTGALAAIGEPDGRPVPPLNLVGDIGGGTMFLLSGILAALYDRERTGRGVIVDAAIVDGTLQLSNIIWQLRAQSPWRDIRGSNTVDGGAPFYRTYECSDGQYVAVGAIEPQFYAELLSVLGLDPQAVPDRHDRTAWPSLHRMFAAAFATRTRDEWAELARDRDACLTPVLSFSEVATHPHIAARAAMCDREGVPLPAPAPRLVAQAATVPQ